MVLTEFDEEKFEAMLREEGRQEGLKEGELLQLCKLVSKKIVSLDSALQECNLSKEAFIEKMRQFGLQMQ